MFVYIYFLFGLSYIRFSPLPVPLFTFFNVCKRLKSEADPSATQWSIPPAVRTVHFAFTVKTDVYGCFSTSANRTLDIPLRSPYVFVANFTFFQFYSLYFKTAVLGIEKNCPLCCSGSCFGGSAVAAFGVCDLLLTFWEMCWGYVKQGRPLVAIFPPTDPASRPRIGIASRPFG